MVAQVSAKSIINKHLRSSINISFDLVLQINRKYTATNILLGKDTFVVTVFLHADYVFIAALVVILDEIHRERFD
jgi:hypothetical protein